MISEREAFRPIMPWMGGKRRLAKHLLPLFPTHTCYVEPFCGAAALFFLKPPSKVEIINDVNGDLTTLYRVVRYHLRELVKEYRWALTSRQTWDTLSAVPVEALTDIQRAARLLYLQRAGFGGKVAGRSFGTSTTCKPKLQLDRLKSDLAQAHRRLAQATIEHLPWEACVARYDREHTFQYWDPPYWKVAGYGVAFDWRQYEQLAETMRTCRSKVLLSINDHPDIRACFSGLQTKELAITYNLGRKNGRTAARRELVIANYPAW